jgi:hypothetical protein
MQAVPYSCGSGRIKQIYSNQVDTLLHSCNISYVCSALTASSVIRDWKKANPTNLDHLASRFFVTHEMFLLNRPRAPYFVSEQPGKNA